MAEELVVSTVIGLLRMTIAAAADRIGLVPGFKNELKKMEGHAEDIQALLADAETKQSKSATLLLWLKEVRGAAFEAENALDELLYEGLRRKVHETNRGARAKVCLFFSMSKHDISFRMRMSYKVRGINEKLKGIKQKAGDVELVRLHHDLLLTCETDAMVEAANRQTDSLPEQFVVGRSKEESDIVDMLFRSSDDHIPPVSVLPIVGMGGLGKTTLAKSIYNNEKIGNHFSKRCWVCVSDKFEVTTILKGILESLKGGGRVEVSSRDDIVRGIQKEVSGERFLFVLDDVWNEESRLWDSFYTSLVGLNSANGSCCVLTTRLETTANLVSTSSFKPFVLGKLSGDDCWLIIGRKATKGGEMPGEFDIYKEEILKKSQGLPLAANAIGGLLSSQGRERWSSIMEKILKIQKDVEGEITPVLKLSYDYLPSRCIKKCFVYCSVYPKDAQLDGEKLIELWMAEGYLQEGGEGRTMEKVGADYLTVLLQSSLLEKVCSSNRQYQFQMHDLVHDLACSISNEEQHDGGRCRNLAVGRKWVKHQWNENSTLIRVVESVSDEILLKYRHARVMYLVSNEIKKLPNAIGKLKHVRCLTLELREIKSLPESLCKLYNLQTLKLSDCWGLQCLPRGLSNLISLRHLYFCTDDEELKMPPNMGRLTCLQTLEFFNVWKGSGREIKEVGLMENLKGSLSIRNLELVKSKEEATSANLFKKKNLTKLELQWGSTIARCDRDNWEDVLEGLEPCSVLQRLRITNFMGVRFPGWLWKLSELVALKLYDCENITELGYSGDSGFPNLKTLSICRCCQLSSAPTSFPILEKLRVMEIQVSAFRDIIGKSTNSLKDLLVSEMQVSTLRGVIGESTNSLEVLSLQAVSMMNSLSELIESPLSSSLKKLCIEDCEDLTEIPNSTLECCRYLEWLTVDKCPELVSCPLNLQQTSSLSTIQLTDCPKLFTTDGILPRGFEYLTNLKVLRIGQDNSQHSIDWDGLKTGCSTTLRRLYIFGSLRTQLPQQLEDFSSLVVLRIYGFDSLERLPGWLAKLTSLRGLVLRNCPKLEHLPTDAIRSLTNLQYLEIDECPLLRETQGDEIKALPNLQVNWPRR